MPLGVAAKGNLCPTNHSLEGESMTARHWMQIAALTSALGVTGGAIAQGAGPATSPDARSSVSSTR